MLIYGRPKQACTEHCTSRTICRVHGERPPPEWSYQTSDTGGRRSFTVVSIQDGSAESGLCDQHTGSLRLVSADTDGIRRNQAGRSDGSVRSLVGNASTVSAVTAELPRCELGTLRLGRGIGQESDANELHVLD